MLWWMKGEALEEGVHRHQPLPSLTLLIDSSLSDWGAHLPRWNCFRKRRTQELGNHINSPEMKALLNGFIAFQDQVISQDLLLISDNTSVVAYVNEQEECCQNLCGS